MRDFDSFKDLDDFANFENWKNWHDFNDLEGLEELENLENRENFEDLDSFFHQKENTLEKTDQKISKTQDTLDYQPDTTTTRSWQAIRDECISGGLLDDQCNIIAASKGTGKLDVIQKRLSCGCILVPEDIDEILL